VSDRLERLAAAGIQIIAAGVISHYILERDGFVAFVERKGDDFGNIGAPGLMTEKGFAALVWRGGRAFFVARGFEQAATDDQVEKIRDFADDLEQALARNERE
jgi:hypothetical protein